jgi:alpha-tubulin suppressor-like RCC1 family protein
MNVLNVLFIDRSVPDFQVFVDSVNANTIPILYDTQSATDWNLPETVERIGIVFIQGPSQLFGPQNNFLVSLIQQHSIKQIDFLACNTLPLWQSYYDQLAQTGVVVGASNNRTGNLQYGGDWTMESTGQDIELIYFTKSIEYYKYLLDSGYHSMIIKSDGTLFTTGYNLQGQLGIGTNANVNTIRPATNMSNIVAISTGQFHSVALKNDGTVWATGQNSDGQLGIGNNTNINTFQPALNMSNIVAITTGHDSSLALKSDGTVLGTGNNGNNQLGNGKSTNINTFQPSLNMSNIIAISGGQFHSVALKNDGTVWTTGDNGGGLLGIGTSTGSADTFQPALNMSNIVAISGGRYHSLALKIDGTVWAAGSYSYGQLGNGTYTNTTYTFQPAVNMSNIVAIAGGNSHSIALKNDGTVFTTGNNEYGQLGIGTNGFNSSTNTFQPALNMSNIVAIGSGYFHSLALKIDGTVFTTGRNFEGQLGLGTYSDVNTFRPAVNVSNIISIQSKPLPQSSPLIRSDGTLYTIGNNLVGQSGTNTKSFLKDLTPVDTSVTSVGTTRYGMLYLKNNLLYYSGYNQYGELGTTNSSTLVTTGNDKLISVISNMVFTNVSTSPSVAYVTQFASGMDHSLFLNSSSMVYATGLNNFGQLGLGNTTNSSTLTVIPNVSNVTLVETGYDFSAVVSAGRVYSFGNNTYGQLGLGNTTAVTTPNIIPNMSSVSSSACGNYHMLFLSNNQVYSCGMNAFGQLGLGTTANQSSPTLVSRLINIVSVSAGGNNSAALDAVGNLWLWGQDYTSTPFLTQSQVTYVNVTLNGIFYVQNNTYNLLKGDRLTFSYSDGQITLPTGQTIPFSVRSNICFLADTPVTTDQGDILIVNLNPNKHTIRGKRIVAITETFSTEKYLVSVDKDAFFTGCPTQKTVMSKEHKVFYQGKMIEAYLLVNNQTIHKIPYHEEKLYNVLLEDHGRMKVNNMIVETLDPANTIGKVFKAIHEAMNNAND